MAIPYTKQTWVDGSGGGTPLSAARLGVIENGILDVSLAPMVRVFHSTTQSITTATLTALNFDSERIDQVSGGASTMHDNATNNTRLTALTAGVYFMTGHLQWASSAAGTIRMIRIRLNGATYIAAQWNAPIASTAIGMSVATMYPMAVNDYVELMAYQDSGGNLSTSVAGNFSPEFAMGRIG